MEEITGWTAIEAEFEKIYKDQEPLHFGTIIKYCLGGDDPLDGISVYESEDYYHFVSFGLTDLYDEKTSSDEYSGYGMEFTCKIKKDDRLDMEKEINNICNIFQSLARYTFNDGHYFLPNEFLSTGQTVGLDAFRKSNITGFIMVHDSEVKTIDTIHGKVEFVCFVGVTKPELDAIIRKELKPEELYEKLGSDVTDYFRDSVIAGLPFKEKEDVSVITCNHILEGKSDICYVSHDAEDGGWQFLCGVDSHDENDARVISLKEAFEIDNSVGQLSDMDEGYYATRKNKNEKWEIFKN